MKRSFFLIIALVISLAAAWHARAQDTNSDSRPNFDSFQVIERNNIFNPNRRPPRNNRDSVPQPRVYTFTLDGTMSYENKGYAFFEGNAAGRGRVYAPADTINGYKIAEITNNTVILTAASNQVITLKVGMQMRKIENGPWKLSGSSESAENSHASSSDASSDEGSGESASASAPIPSIPGASADMVKKLMMRRRAAEGEETNSATANGDQTQ